MISKKSLNIALLGQADIATTGTDYDMLAQMQEYKEQINKGYVREYLLFGDDIASSLAYDSCYIQDGIYQLTINSPRVDDSSELDALGVVDTIQSGFPRGLKLTHDDQTLRITTSSVRILEPTDTHLKTVISIGFSVRN